MNFDHWGGRRFALTVLAQISANVLVWHGKISDGVYSAVVLATVAAYITGNISQRSIEAKAQQGEASPR
mgnify:FL=1